MFGEQASLWRHARSTFLQDVSGFACDAQPVAAELLWLIRLNKRRRLHLLGSKAKITEELSVRRGRGEDIGDGKQPPLTSFLEEQGL